MPNYVNRRDFPDCQAVGILKAKLSEAECLEMIIDDIGRHVLYEGEFMEKLKRLDGARSRLSTIPSTG